VIAVSSQHSIDLLFGGEMEVKAERILSLDDSIIGADYTVGELKILLRCTIFKWP